MTESELKQMVAALSERVGRLEDLQAINSLHRNFTRAVAEREFTELADYFCSDAVIDMRRHGPIAGRNAIAEHFAGMAAVPLAGAGYVLSSPVIDVDGDTATGTWTWHRLYAEPAVDAQHDGGRVAWQEGRYQCHYRRTDAGWRFEHMHFRVVLPDPDDTPDTSEETR